jgi:two-component system OmpR family response regulator
MKREDLQTVLYVDDEPDIREVVSLSLSLVSGLTVHTCESGECALQLVPQLRPDMIFLDVMMPGMDGPTTLQQLRAMPDFESIPVVFMTAKAMPQEVARFRELGANSVIAKPFDPLTLGDQVVAIWQGLSR